MTHEQWIALTPEQQRIKVAELCGWHKLKVRVVDDWCDGYGEQHDISDLSGQLPLKPDCIQIYDRVPDYLNDLNAMHEAEKLLVGGLSWEYHKQLCDIAMEEWRATAAQRAEAFVLTMEGI